MDESSSLSFSDPAAMYEGDQALKGRIQQLGRGRMCGRAVGIASGDVEVWILSVNRSAHARCALETDDFLLSTVVACDGPVRHNGRPFGPGDAVEYRPGLENTQAVAAGTYLDVRCRPQTARRRGWAHGGETHRRIPPGVLRQVVRFCYQRLAPNRAADRQADLQFVSNLLEALDRIPPSAPQPRPPASAGLVRRATEVVEESLEGRSLGVSELATELGVSERTLYRAFQCEMGTGPYDYLLARRLNRMRRRLLAEPRTPGAVTRAASAAGFDHLGDMGRMYKRLFGETPRQTLQRAAS